MNPLSITTASGRRVSILCDNECDSRTNTPSSVGSYSTGSYFPPLAMNPTPPLSPDHRRPCLTDRSDSFSSTISSSSIARSPLTPPTPECLSLPPLDKMIGRRPSFERRLSCSSTTSSVAASPMLSPQIVDDELPASPKSPNANSAVIKRSTRKYTCHCGKSFTTSGHLARHTRIHTGEKNYECPEPGCGARFSRQDNCMQHYRTHQSGGAKRTSRKKRSDAPSLVSHHSSRFVPQLHNLPESAFNAESGLAALASVAISSYQ